MADANTSRTPAQIQAAARADLGRKVIFADRFLREDAAREAHANLLHAMWGDIAACEDVLIDASIAWDGVEAAQTPAIEARHCPAVCGEL